VQLAPRRLRSARYHGSTHLQPHPPPAAGPQQPAFADGSQQDACSAALQHESRSLDGSLAPALAIVSVGGRSAATTGSRVLM